MIGLLTKKTSGCDFDITDFEEADFEVHGWGWSGILEKKSKLVGILKVEGD
jgi:hypothetical protein